MSTTDYLKTLDYDQLVFAKEHAELLIKEKDAESRVKVWLISDDCLNFGCFPDDQYEEAVQYMASVLLKRETKKHQLGFDLQIRKITLRESEVPEYMALNKN